MRTGERTKNLPLTSEYGKTYLSLCYKVNKLVSKDNEKIEKKNEHEKKKLMDIDSQLKSARKDLNWMMIKHGTDHKGYKKEKRRYYQKRKKLITEMDKIKQEEFHNAVKFLGWELEIHEVLLFAGFVAFMGLMGIGMIFTILTILGLSINDLLMFTPALILTPLVLYVLTANYPEMLCKRVKVKAIGKAPECISYMVMSMSLNPALDHAVKFTSKYTDEPLATGFRGMIWDVMMRKFNSIEEALVHFAMSWGEWNEDLRQALYIIRSSTLESSKYKIEENLNKAYDVILTGTKSTMEDFASTLSGPTMILFALGVILPLVIGALLPLVSLQLPTAGEIGTATISEINGGEDLSPALSVPVMVLIMNVAFPTTAILYSWHILGKRPGTSTAPQVENKLTLKDKNLLLIISIVGGIFISLLAIPPFSKYSIFPSESILPILLGITFAISFYLISLTKAQKKRKDELTLMENEFHNALFQLGNRIAEGKPVEKALEDVAEGLKGSRIDELFEDIRYRLKLTNLPLLTILYDKKNGVLKDYPSRTIRASMLTVVEATQKDNITAGRIITHISSYLRDLKKIENEIKNTLSPAVGMMKSTSLFFAPIVMGVTTGLYNLLYDQFRSLPGSSVAMISPSIFTAILGVFLFFMTIIMIYFSVGILDGDDPIELKYSIGVGLPVSMVIFTMVSLLSQAFVGV